MTNTLTLDESKPYYERFAIPGAGHVLWEGANTELNPRTGARVDFHRNNRAPLLLIGNGRDHVTPANVAKVNAHRYHKSGAITEFVEYPDRPHLTAGLPGWEEVADSALDWSAKNAATYAS